MMQMSDSEIRERYRLAKYPSKIPQILAELNACPVAKIKAIINGEKYIEKKKQLYKPRIHWKKISDGDYLAIEAIHKIGKSYAQIARELNISKEMIYYQKRKRKQK